MIYIQIVLKEEYTNVSNGRIDFILFSEQAVCKKGYKMKKGLLDEYW